MDSLNQLKDIHLPESIGWWPLAPGWYVIIIGFIVLSLIMAYKAYQWYNAHRAKRQALKLLADYYQLYQHDSNCQLISAKLSELLKRVALAYYPRAQVAGLRGEKWICFLNETAKDVNFNPVKHMLLECPFKSQHSCLLNPLFAQTKAWIKQRRKPCLS